jgi:hypothetical protein
MTVKAKSFTKQLHVDFDRDEQVHVLFSDPEPDGSPKGGIWLKFDQHLQAPFILVRAETSEGVVGTFRAKVSDHRSFVVPHELEKDEMPGLQGVECPVIVLRPGKPDSDAARFWVLIHKNVNGVPNTPCIIAQTTTGSAFGSDVRPHEKRGQQRSVSIKDHEWEDRHVRFIEVSIADLPPCLGGPAESLDTWKTPTA